MYVFSRMPTLTDFWAPGWKPFYIESGQLVYGKAIERKLWKIIDRSKVVL